MASTLCMPSMTLNLRLDHENVRQDIMLTTRRLLSGDLHVLCDPALVPIERSQRIVLLDNVKH